MSFRRLIRNLRKMQEAKDAAPAMVPRAVADNLVSLLTDIAVEYSAERHERGARGLTDLERSVGQAIDDYRNWTADKS